MFSGPCCCSSVCAPSCVLPMCVCMENENNNIIIYTFITFLYVNMHSLFKKCQFHNVSIDKITDHLLFIKKGFYGKNVYKKNKYVVLQVIKGLYEAIFTHHLPKIKIICVKGLKSVIFLYGISPLIFILYNNKNTKLNVTISSSSPFHGLGKIA